MINALEVSAVTVSLSDGEVVIMPFFFVMVLGALIIIPIALSRRWYFYRRRLSKNIITAEYAPPAGLNPAEVGYMFDGKLREREVAATIVHLVQRGLLHVKKNDGKKLIFAGPRVENNLKTYERKLIEQADVEGGVTADELLSRFTSYKVKNTQVTVATREFVFTQLVHADLQKSNYVRASSKNRFFIGSLKIAMLMLVLIIYVPFLILWIVVAMQEGATDFSGLFIIALVAVFSSMYLFLPFLMAGVVLNYVRGRIVGREWIITPKLKQLWPQIVGFRQYVKLVENERLEFQTKELATVSRNDALPYAVALGFVKNWREIIS